MGEGDEKCLESEDWCFVCKDGGDLILCDHKDCVKVYHPDCVEESDGDVLLGTKKRYTCERHACMECGKASKFYCLCCPTGLCKRCLKDSQLVLLRGKRGLCSTCLDSVIQCEENAQFDKNGEKIDYTDRDTDECLFKEYWDIIKKDEDLTLEDVYSADVRLKKHKNFKDGKQVRAIVSDSGFLDCPTRKSGPGSKKKEFLGWGSKPLIKFLNSIGKDTSKPLSQYEVDSIVSEYVQERGLTHPEKKKKVVCDEGLFSVFRKKVIIKNMIYNLLEDHFADNYWDLSDEEDENKNKNERNEKSAMSPCKKQKTSPDPKPKSQEKDVIVSKVRKSCYASIVVDNMKRVYLRRSLVEELLKEAENFERKVVGCFVKVEPRPRDYTQRSPYQLLQVTGIKKTPDSEILLQLLNIHADVPISALSDYNCTEDDCEGLREKVKNGSFEKLTIVEVEEKAKVLHELITKDWIPRELDRLQNRIDFMNEKGRRREYPFWLSELLEERAMLRTPAEQLRLLGQVPEIIAEEIEQVGPSPLGSAEVIAEEIEVSSGSEGPNSKVVDSI